REVPDARRRVGGAAQRGRQLLVQRRERRSPARRHVARDEVVQRRITAQRGHVGQRFVLGCGGGVPPFRAAPATATAAAIFGAPASAFGRGGRRGGGCGRGCSGGCGALRLVRGGGNSGSYGGLGGARCVC